MNILASYNWIKEYLDTKVKPEEFARRVSLSGPGIERSHPQAPLFANMVVGKVLEVKPHPNADKLRLAVTDLGGTTATIVCGGSNLEVGMKVAVALEGAKVLWHGQGEPVTLEPATIRGVKSEGMICAANEIGLADAFPHAEREVMDLSWCTAKPGTSIAKAFELDDTVFDIEVTTNRPDAYSIVGLAREAAAILGEKFTWKETVTPTPSKKSGPVPLEVKLEAPELCTRYQAVVMDKVAVGPSPWWVKNRLRMSGIRPINAIVDITNYVMLELGQPMHAFDYDKLAGGMIVVRKARKGEKLLLLDGTERELAPDQLVIADAEKPVAVAGVMGGEHSGVSPDTKVIVFESATFDAVSVRRTSRALDLRSDSSARFEKGLPEELTQAAIARAVELCERIACGRVAGKLADVRGDQRKRKKFPFRPDRAAALIGVDIPAKRMFDILKSLGFEVAKKPSSAKASEGKGMKYEVTVPYWRERDIEDERDFSEEIARVYGYANLPSELPTGELPRREHDAVLLAEDGAKTFFASVGYTEFINYSFISREAVVKADYDPDACLKVRNELSADFELMRPSLIPGMLQAIAENEGLFPEGRVFEASNVYLKKDGANLPDERSTLLLAAYGPAGDDAHFRAVKGALEPFCPGLGRTIEMVRIGVDAAGTRWHPGRTVELRANGKFIGTLGDLHPEMLGRFGIDGKVCMAEIDLMAFVAAGRVSGGYAPIPQFPPALRDIAVVVDERVEYADMLGVINARAAKDTDHLLHEVSLFDVYRGKGIDAGKKSVALHLEFLHPHRTLTAEEVDAQVDAALIALADACGAIRRG